MSTGDGWDEGEWGKRRRRGGVKQGVMEWNGVSEREGVMVWWRKRREGKTNTVVNKS